MTKMTKRRSAANPPSVSDPGLSLVPNLRTEMLTKRENASVKNLERKKTARGKTESRKRIDSTARTAREKIDSARKNASLRKSVKKPRKVTKTELRLLSMPLRAEWKRTTRSVRKSRERNWKRLSKHYAPEWRP